MSCYYCVHNVEDKACALGVEGFPLPPEVECMHFWFDTGDDEDDLYSVIETKKGTEK